jgi:hypothetical protein
VFALFNKRLFFLPCFGHASTRMDSGWSALLRDISHPWVDSVPHFPKIGRLTAPVGYICRDFLFNVAVASSGWTIRQDRSTTVTNLTCPSVEGGTLAIHNRHAWTATGWSGGIGDIVEAAWLRRKEAARTRRGNYCASPITPMADGVGRICDLSLATGRLFASSTRDAGWSIGSSPILQTGAEEALPLCGREKDAGQGSCASRIYIYLDQR